ncbi:MAG: Bacteriophage repressor helix-turn-helix domain [Pseudomonadota bacterium]|jgi:transcriptional regulator with XRE-family HTH domain
MGQRERVEEAMTRAKFNSQQEIADACGVTQPAISALLGGKFPMLDLLQKIAEKTNVSFEWLRFGDVEKAPSWATVRDLQRLSEEPVAYSAGARVDIVGQVVAGDGELDGFEDLTESVAVPDGWRLILVHGMSAYPVFYKEQFAWVDINRAVRPSAMSEKDCIDLHDNVVVVQAEANGRRLGLLKRFNYQPNNPARFQLSSLDGGRSSPYVDPDTIHVILPCVGSWWIDPRKPRKKLFHAKTVVPQVGK